MSVLSTESGRTKTAMPVRNDDSAVRFSDRINCTSSTMRTRSSARCFVFCGSISIQPRALHALNSALEVSSQVFRLTTKLTASIQSRKNSAKVLLADAIDCLYISAGAGTRPFCSLTCQPGGRMGAPTGDPLMAVKNFALEKAQFGAIECNLPP